MLQAIIAWCNILYLNLTRICLARKSEDVLQRIWCETTVSISGIEALLLLERGSKPGIFFMILFNFYYIIFYRFLMCWLLPELECSGTETNYSYINTIEINPNLAEGGTESARTNFKIMLFKKHFKNNNGHTSWLHLKFIGEHFSTWSIVCSLAVVSMATLFWHGANGSSLKLLKVEFFKSIPNLVGSPCSRGYPVHTRKTVSFDL